MYARAVLIDILAEMNGGNNGAIVRSTRQIAAAVGINFRRIRQAIGELHDHGFIDVAAEGSWISRTSREYRFTFVTMPGRPATNDYLVWAKLGDAKAAADRRSTATTGEADHRNLDAAARARIAKKRRENGKTVKLALLPRQQHI